LENWGVWSLQKKAVLNIPLQPTEKDLSIYVQCARPSQGSFFGTRINGQEFDKVKFSESEEIFKFTFKGDSNDCLRIEFNNQQLTDLSVETNKADLRTIGMGLVSIMVCESDDLLARLEYVESFGKVTSVSKAKVRGF